LRLKVIVFWLRAIDVGSRIVSAGLVTSKSNSLQLLVALTKKTNYLISYFCKIVTSYFTS